MESKIPKFYSAESVRRTLNWPLVNDAVDAALKAVVTKSSELPADPKQQSQPDVPFVNQPTRSFTTCGNKPGKILLTMPAFVGNYRLSAEGDAGNVLHSTLACKLVTSFTSNRQLQPPLPSIAANILLFNSTTGLLEAIMAGDDITAWRTVSASLAATKYLYFRRFGPHAEQQLAINVGIVGCGVQGQLHAAAMCANYQIKKLCLYNRTESVATRLAQELRERLATVANSNYATKLPEIVVCSTPHEAVQEADVICIATYSPNALIHAKDLTSERALHINAVGAGEVHFGEVSADIYEKSLVYVDSMANANSELRGLPAPIAGELGSIMINGNYPAEQSLTIFQSMGMASEDACVAKAVQIALLSNAN